MLYLLIFIEIAFAFPSLSLPTQSAVLDNGMRVYVHSVPQSGMVHALVHYDIGDGDVEKNGLAHLVEHLMFEPATHFQGHSYDHLLEEVGGSSNAKTGLDYIRFSSTVPIEGLERLLFLEADRMFQLCGGLTQEDIANQIDVVIQEFLTEQIDPFFSLDSL